ncbi:MAG: hypothetical protein EBZ74_06175 [Planctomycetia bacterium]|nr:hypothetical protein [Planctomycetia bacterium]
MSDKRAGGIFASSFVAGLLLAAGIFAPRAWDPVPEPFFGLDEQAVPEAAGPGTAAPGEDRTAEAAGKTAPARDTVGTAAAPPGERLALGDQATPAAMQAAAIAAREAVAAAPVAPPVIVPPAAEAAASPPAASAPSVSVAPGESAAGSLRALVTRVQASRAPPPPAAPETLGVAPLPGAEWVDPDSVNWSDVPLAHPAPKPTVPVPRLGLRPRLRVGERLLGRDRPADSSPAAVEDGAAGLPDVRRWPAPRRLVQQIEQLGAAGPAHDAGAWSATALERLQRVLATAGPGDAAAEPALVTLGESVHAGMGIADASTDHDRATATRRAALAVSRRVATWRAATGLCLAADAVDSRLEAETARLLDAVERFESSGAPEDAAVAARAMAVLVRSGQPPAVGLARAVQDHYLSANVRVAVHQRFLERLLPAATVITGPVDDVVLGRKVRGTRTVQRTTTVRFVPDSDEISFELEVHGDVESRTVTDSGPVSLTSRGDSSFTVRKPIKLSPAGLLFGAATGVASNRSQLANVQTSFDSVPIMRSLVRSIARSQHEETLPEANREVIDHIVSRACREVDAQAEPRFSEIASRIRDRVWTPLVRLGLDPTPVALETTPAVATLRLRLAADEQLAAHTPRPRAPGDALFSLQVHESTLNNALERLGLAGRRMALEDLVALLCERAGSEPRLPDDLPEGVHVTFARRQPLRVECRDGLVHVRVALDAIESGRRSWYDIVAQVAYKPAQAAPQVFLEREGPVQLSGPGHQGRIEFALRTIFSKIFPKERPIPVLPERLVKNPRLEGLHVLQAASTDGWLALALGIRDGETTVAQPGSADGRKADQRPRIFR